MIESKKKIKQSNYIALLTSVIFLLYMLLTPIVYNQSSEMVLVINSSENADNSHIPIHQDRKISLISTAFIEYELLKDVVSNLSLYRIMQETKQLITSVSSVLTALLFGYGMLLRYRRCLINRTRRHKSIMAFSIGGHAPPRIYLKESLLY